MKVAIIGTVGVPANYGGFETLVENLIGEHCSPDIEYTVFCSSKSYTNKIDRYKNARLKYVPFKANDIQCIPYDTISLIRCMRGYDIILYLGISVPIFRFLKKFCSAKIIANIDGLSHERGKYKSYQKYYLDYLTKNEILAPDAIIADNIGIQKFARDNYNRDSYLIAYGGDQALVEVSSEIIQQVLDKTGVKKGRYAISVCRIEPENNCHLSLDAFVSSGIDFVFIGNWDKNEYGRELKSKYGQYPNIKILDPIYDSETLYALRSNAQIYIHGHSVGGTNPSLVEAMFLGIPIICYDVIYNRATTFGKADYFTDENSLRQLISCHKESGKVLKELAEENYTWKHITKQYEDVYRKVLGNKR